MWRAPFRDRITHSNSNGGQRILRGEEVVYVDQIPPDAPQDWEIGPPQKPGKWGVYLQNRWHPRLHGPYAIASAATPQEAMDAAAGFFVPLNGTKLDENGQPVKIQKLQSPVWEEVTLV